MRFTHNPTGNELILHGMDDQEKIKSIAGITSVWCEEATELDELDFNQLELRVRGETLTYKQFIITFNPISETHWIKARFFDAPDEDTLLLNTTYKDNHFLDADYIKHLTERVRNNENLYKVYVLGEWGKVDFGGEFLKCWSTVKHTSFLHYDPSLAIWLSFDENVNPYFPCGIFQITDENEIRMIDCVALKNPNNTTKEMGRTILNKLRKWQHKGQVYICGDATSQKDDVKVEKGFDLFRILITELQEVNPIRRVSRSNPNVRPSADFFNAILDYNEQGISFVVHEDCRTAILDYENTKEDKNGKVDKKTVTDPVTKVSYQPYGHVCFIGETLIKTINGEKRIDNISTNDYVLTSKGYKKVLGVHCNGYKKVNTYLINGSKITCTPNHLIYTFNFGYIEIQKVVTLSMYLDIFIIIFDKNNNKCKQTLLNIVELDLQDTQNLTIEQKECITQDGLKLMKKQLKKDFIGLSILTRLATFLKGVIFTTLTKTHLITTFQILNLFVVSCILQHMQLYNLKGIHYIKRNFMLLALKLLKNGIKAKMVENGIVIWLKKGTQKENIKQNYVLCAILNIKQRLYKMIQNFVQIIAKVNIDDYQELTMSQLVVGNAEMNLSKTNIQLKNIVHEDVQMVFDLSIDEKSEYFANNVLFHNCDLTRYLITTVFSTEYHKFQVGLQKPIITTGRDYETKVVTRF